MTTPHVTESMRATLRHAVEPDDFGGLIGENTIDLAWYRAARRTSSSACRRRGARRILASELPAAVVPMRLNAG